VVPASGHLFYVERLDVPELSDVDQHHAARVLRLREGEVLTIADGHGSWVRGRWEGGAVVVDGDVASEPTVDVTITVGFALVKGSKPELVVQKLTELGVDRIVPFTAARSVVRWDDDKSSRAHERLLATAREAGMQSRRARLPRVDAPAGFTDAVAIDGVAIADRTGRPVGPADHALLIGPEGGWDADELAAADAVSLADHVLRSETAAIVAGVTLSGFRSGRFHRGG
jgi:16S rRNA (uracil1498-N3)-methyltransferase